MGEKVNKKSVIEMYMNKLGIVLWKNFIIRKRHFLLTAIEVALPIVLFYIFYKTKDAMVPLNGPSSVIENHPEPLEFINTVETTLLYTPRNEFTEDIIRRTQETLQLPSNYIIPLESEKELHEHYVRNHNNTVIGVIFNGNDATQFDYTIRLHNENKPISWFTDKLYLSDNTNEASNYKQQCFLTIQFALDQAYIEKQSGRKLDILVEMKAFAQPTTEHEVFSLLADLLPYVTVFSFLCIIPSVLKSIVEEKETGIKELQKMSGLKVWMSWFGWFLHGMIPSTLSTVIIVVLLKNSFITYTNGFILYIFLILYCMSVVVFCFFVSTLGNKPNLAMTFGIVYWIVSHPVPVNILMSYGTTITWFFKCLVTLLFPNAILHFGFAQIITYEKLNIGIQFGNLNKAASRLPDDITMLNVIVMYLLNMLLFMALALYVDNINPGPYGIKKPLSFPIKCLYRLFVKSSRATGPLLGEPARSNGEHNTLLPTGIELRGLKKIFGRTVAVNNLSLDIYKNQITVLLGQNGAGKTTTMHMMTGMIECSKGDVIINGKSVKDDLDEIRMNLGLCTQHNLMFPDLTVIEQLMFFGMLKGLSKKVARSKAKELIELLNLDDKDNNLGHTLSGGMKRKLCLGMALIGDPKVLILDEPTSGMDPESRREIWNLLLRIREQRTILITTHFLDEADVLGDWIAIMNNGILTDHGTPLDLKKKYNTGYHLSLIVEHNVDKAKIEEKIHVLLKNNRITDYQVLSSYSNKLVYVLQIEDKPKFAKFFETLESRKDLNIVNTSLALTTLEDVFLSTLKHTGNYDEPDVSSIGTYSKSKKCGRMIWGSLFEKRWFYAKKSIKKYLLPLLISALALYLAFALSQAKFTTDVSNNIEPKLRMTLDIYGPTTVYYSVSSQSEEDTRFTNNPDLTDNDFVKREIPNYDYFPEAIPIAYSDHVRKFNSKPIKTDKIDATIKEMGEKDVEFFKTHMVAAAEFGLIDKTPFAYAHYSPSAYHSAPISLNLITNAIAKSYIGRDVSITMSNWPLENMDVKVSKTLYEPQVKLTCAFFIPLAALFLLCEFISFPFEEISTKFIKIQIMSGVKPRQYWGVNWLFDALALIIAFLVILLIQILLQLTLDFNMLSLNSLGFFVFFMVTCGVCSIPFTYLFSHKKTLTGGIALFILLGIFLIVVPLVAVNLLLAFGVGKWKHLGEVLNVVFLLYCPPYGFAKVTSYFAQQTARSYNWLVISPEDKKIECYYHPHPCCQDAASKKCTDYLGYFTNQDTTVLSDMALIAVGAIQTFMLIVFLHSLYFKKIIGYFQRLWSKYGIFSWFSDSSNTSTSGGPDRGKIIETKFEAKYLEKSYNRKKVVNIPELTMEKGLCYGLLGVNGAGKTTTFNMLTWETISDNKNIKLKIKPTDNTEDTEEPSNYLNKLGYCPQVDCLNFALTAHDLLLTIAKIRCLENPEEVVKDFLKIFDLEKYKDQPCLTYSGGNKRKLSMAISLIGMEHVVLLDEPTNGVDPASRRNFWITLKKFQNNGDNPLTTLLTSHSMAECEALCDRMMILKDGVIHKQGTIADLKKEVSGYTINFKLKVADPVQHVDQVDGVDSSFNLNDFQTDFKRRYVNFETENKPDKAVPDEDCVLTDEHMTSLTFHIKSKKRWSQVLGLIEEVKMHYQSFIEDYNVSEASLEDVFLKVARERKSGA